MAFLLAGALWTFGSVGAQAQTSTSTTTTGRCATGTCPLNIGGSFSWQDSVTSVSGQFTGSIIAFPHMIQAPCATAAGLDSSKGPATGAMAPHPGVIVPEPFTKPGPGKPLTAYISITGYHGPGTYTNAAFAHQTYVYPVGVNYATSPADDPDSSAWSFTMAADGSGHLTYSGPAQDTGVGPKIQINLTMSWQCNDRATPVGVAQGAATTTTANLPGTTASGQPTNHRSHVNVVAIVVVAVLLLAILGLVLRARRRQTRRPPCRCSATISVSGPSQIGIRDCARAGALEHPWTPGVGSPRG